MPQTQEEFYFGYPYEAHGPLDVGTIRAWRNADGSRLASASKLGTWRSPTPEIERRRVATEYLHAHPIILEPPG